MDIFSNALGEGRVGPRLLAIVGITLMMMMMMTVILVVLDVMKIVDSG